MRNKAEAASTVHCLVAYGYMALWIALSATVIMFNKYILAPDLGGFPFPLTLTGVHMAFCSAVSWLLVKAKLVEVQDMPVETYTRCVVPIGVLFAVTLWMGNAAYLHLSVSFIQMVKALMPMLVYSVGVALGTEQWSGRTGSILAVVVGGVLLASYGEVVFVLLGVLFQGVSLLSEATRLTLVQLLLQQKGFKLSPISTMYHISPVCFMALLIPLATLEAEKVMKHDWNIGPAMLLCSAAAAFALNCAVFLLVGKTSALTMNIAGVVKDVMLVYLSVTVYGSHVTPAQVAGYAVALCGAFAYNYSKMHKPRPPTNRLSISGRVSIPGHESMPGGRLSVSGSGSKSASKSNSRHSDQAQPHDRQSIPCNSGVSTARASAQVARERRVSSASADCSVAVAVGEPAKQALLGASDSRSDSMPGAGMWGAGGRSSLKLSTRLATAQKCR